MSQADGHCVFGPWTRAGDNIVVEFRVERARRDPVVFLVTCEVGDVDASGYTGKYDVTIVPVNDTKLTANWGINDFVFCCIGVNTGYKVLLRTVFDSDSGREVVQDIPNVAMDLMYVLSCDNNGRDTTSSALEEDDQTLCGRDALLWYNFTRFDLDRIFANDHHHHPNPIIIDEFEFDSESLEEDNHLNFQIANLRQRAQQQHQQQHQQYNNNDSHRNNMYSVLDSDDDDQRGAAAMFNGWMRATASPMKCHDKQKKRQRKRRATDVLAQREAVIDADVACRVFHSADGKHTRNRFYLHGDDGDGLVSSSSSSSSSSSATSAIAVPTQMQLKEPNRVSKPRQVVQKTQRTKRLKRRNRNKSNSQARHHQINNKRQRK
jgi:hypothetical protein